MEAMRGEPAETTGKCRFGPFSYLNERRSTPQFSLVLNSHFWSYPRTNFKLVVEKVGIMW
jgi:hypothetical protein